MMMGLLGGLAAASLLVAAEAQAAAGCAVLREPKAAAGLHHTSGANGRAGDERLALLCDADNSAGTSYRISVTKGRPGAAAETLSTVTGSCLGTCAVRIGERPGAARPTPAAETADDVVVTVDF